MAISLVDNTTGGGEQAKTGFDKVNQAITKLNTLQDTLSNLSAADIVNLNVIGSLSPTNNNFIVGTGTEWSLETPAQARSSLGVGTTDSPVFTGARLTGLTFGEVVLPTADGTLSGSTNLTFTSGILKVGGTINLDGVSRAIQDNTINAIEFDGSGNVNFPGNITAVGTNTISATQWGYLGAADQGFATTDSVTVAGLTANGNIAVESTDPFLILSGDVANQFESGRVRLTELTTLFQGGYIHYDGSANRFNFGVHNTADALVANDIVSFYLERSTGNIVTQKSISVTGNISVTGTVDGRDISGITATNAELNVLDGATLTTTELNYVDGVTSSIQTQLDGKQPLDAELTTLSGLSSANATAIVGISNTQWGYLGALNQGLTTASSVTFAEATFTSDINALSKIRVGSDGSTEYIDSNTGDLRFFSSDDFLFFPGGQSANSIFISQTGDIFPVGTFVGASRLGSSGNRWDDVFSEDGNFSANVTVGGTLGVTGLGSLDGGIDVNGSNFTVSTAGAVETASTLSVTGASTLTGLLTIANNIEPNVNNGSNIGSVSKRFLTGHISELHVPLLVVSEEIATTGGSFYTGEGNVLEADLTDVATSADFKLNNFASGDFVRLVADGKFEVIKIASAPSGSGPYTYTITRNQDGSGANAWTSGDGAFNTGASSGFGFIHQYATNSETQGEFTNGPAIAHVVRTGTGWNDLAVRALTGNLNGQYGYTTDVYGFASGDASNENITVDATNGLRIRAGTTNLLQATGGSLSVGSNFSYDGTTLSINGSVLVTGSVDTDQLAANAVTAGKIAADTITATEIAANAITTSELAADSVTSAKIVAGTIVASDIASNTITATQIAASTITTSEIAADTITGGNIAANTITSSELAANSVTATEINVTNLAAISADLGAATAGSFVVGTTNKLWLNDSDDGALNIGGSTKATAPFRVTSAGALTATNANITGAITATSGSLSGLDVSGNLTLGTNGFISGDNFQLTKSFLAFTINTYTGSSFQAIGWSEDSGGTEVATISASFNSTGSVKTLNLDAGTQIQNLINGTLEYTLTSTYGLFENDLRVKGSLRHGDGNFALEMIQGGATKMYHNASAKVITESGGATINGSLNITSLPTSSAGLSSGDLFTQTATQLGGSGSTKAVCIV